MGDQEQQDFQYQDSQYDKYGLHDARPPVLEVHFRKEILGRQGTGKEHGSDEQSFKEPVSQTAEANRHQQNGDDPVGYGEQPFHF